MRYSLKQGKLKYPVSEAELGDLLVLSDYTDPTLRILLNSATSAAMAYTGRAFINQEMLIQWDGYPGFGTPTNGLDPLRRIAPEWIELPYPPLVEVESVTLFDRDGEPEAIDLVDVQVDTVADPGRLKFNKGGLVIPDTYRLQIKYTAGYGENAEDVPLGIRYGILQVAGFMYEHRGQCDAGSALIKSGAVHTLGAFRLGRL
jgi:uncharacterized phiE125 gp8 family phage protein